MKPSLLHPELEVPDELALELPLEHVHHTDDIEQNEARRYFRLRHFLAAVGIFAAVMFLLLLVALIAEFVVGYRGRFQGEIHGPLQRHASRAQATFSTPGYARPESFTYLSYVEWYPALSYAELASYQNSQVPSGFPYFRAIREYWGNYRAMRSLTADKYPFDLRENALLVAAGLNFAAGYTIKGTYEKTVGRVSAWTSKGQLTEEDLYDAQVTREFADFTRLHPFYEFRFAHHVARLWSTTNLYGPHFLRKTEREFFLTAEYTVAAFYCWVMEKFSPGRRIHPPETYAWIAAPKDFPWENFPIKNVRQVAPQEFIVAIPHTQEFTTQAQKLVDANVRFVEIAGNGNILISLLEPAGAQSVLDVATRLNRRPLLSDPAQERVLINCPTESLSVVLLALRSQQVTVEHIYDY